MKALWALVLGLGIAGNAWAAAPLSAYGKLPRVTNFRLSPDGGAMAFILTDGEDQKIVINGLKDRQTIGVLEAGKAKIREVLWAGSDHVIVTFSETKNQDLVGGGIEAVTGVIFDLKTRRQDPLLKAVDGAITYNGVQAVFTRVVNGHPMVYLEVFQYDDTNLKLALISRDLDHGGVASIVVPGNRHTNDYLVDANGHALAETHYNPRSGEWTLLVRRGGLVGTELRDFDHQKWPYNPPVLEGVSHDGEGVVVRFHDDHGEVLRETLPSGAWSDAQPAPNDLILDPATQRWIGSSLVEGDDFHLQFFDPADAAAWKSVARAFPGALVSLESWTDDHKALIVRVDQDGYAPAYNYINLASHHAEWIGQEHPELKDGDIGRKEALTFKAGDGLVLHGYVTYPPGRSGKSLPLVVLPHGGPAARDAPGFDWWAQALASRGYAVLQVNFRGSYGYGWDFEAAGFGQWGRKMQTDLSDGVRELVARGVADPKRVCIFGASYGGYAALAAATLDPAPYRCAISVAGPADLRAMTWRDRERAGDEESFVNRENKRSLGPPDTLGEVSPLRFAARVTMPVMLIHGRDDTVVAYEQSQMMAGALHEAHKTVEFVTLDKEDHWLSHGDTRLKMLQSGLDFLAKYNPAD